MAQGGRAEAVKIYAHLDSLSDANDDAGRECGQEIHGAQGAVQFTVHFSFVQNVSAGDVEYRFLGVRAGDRKDDEKQQQKSEGSDGPQRVQGDSG